MSKKKDKAKQRPSYSKKKKKDKNNAVIKGVTINDADKKNATTHSSIPSNTTPSPKRDIPKPISFNEEDLINRQDYQFHNPYNFVPYRDRSAIQKHKDLGDHVPVHKHDRYHDNTWTGSIRISLKTATPLIILDAANPETLVAPNKSGDDLEHSLFNLRLTADNQPFIPATSLKGVLRNAFEMITNSRLSVFDAHDKPLFYRRQEDIKLDENQKEKRFVVPLRIEKRGTTLVTKLPSSPNRNMGLKILQYKTDKSKKEDEPVTYSDGSSPQHGDFVIFKEHEKDKTLTKKDPKKMVYSDFKDWEKGWVFKSGQNAESKQNEKIFPDYENSNSKTKPVSKEIENRYNDLMKEYRALHADSINKRKLNSKAPDQFYGPEPGQTAFSRHIYADDAAKLGGSDEFGTLCYGIIKEKSNNKEFELIDLYPVFFSRAMFRNSPRELVPPSLLPAQTLQELSPCERLFGWVAQKRSTEDKSNLHSAWKGKLRTSEGKCLSPEPLASLGDKGEGLALNILSGPKPQQARFYLASDPKSPKGLNSELEKRPKYHEYFYTADQGLRGRKVYPHQPQTTKKVEDYWKQNPNLLDGEVGYLDENKNLPYFREHLRLGEAGDNQDGQNSTIKQWVKPGTDFEFDISIINASEFELGALLWLLSLNERMTGDKKRYFRIGGGKPLGFGSVELSVDQLNLNQGQSLREYYTTLSLSPVKPDELNEEHLIESFKKTLVDHFHDDGQAEFEDLPFIKAFIKACEGGDLPVHYPRINIKPKAEGGESFHWFEENERENNRKALSPLDEENEYKGFTLKKIVKESK